MKMSTWEQLRNVPFYKPGPHKEWLYESRKKDISKYKYERSNKTERMPVLHPFPAETIVKKYGKVRKYRSKMP